MNIWLRKYLLSSAVAFSPPNEGGAAPDGDDRIPEPDLDDDETSTDPVEETDELAEGDDQDEDQDDPAAAAAGEQPARQSRGDRQYAELRRQARERADENARLTRELAEIRGQISASRQPQVETPQQRAERFALMSPEERADAIVTERLAQHERNQQLLTQQLMDQSDRASFDAQTTSNPLLKKLAPEVERKRQELFQRDGTYVPRATIATYLIGERVLAQQGKAKPGAQERRRQQTAAPVRGGSDVGSSRRPRAAANSAEDFETRFGDVQI
jgi:hypothetical protein